ncbi:MAG: hypothetical protein IH947_13215 [Bacteroidetes bacterium]|nr:hypothetical protein [Bacteroidota bacterium]
MKNPRKLLFYSLLTYFIIVFLGALYIDSKSAFELIDAVKFIPAMKYVSLFGILLFLIFYVVVTRDTRVMGKEIDKLKNDHTSLKAKLFDLQEESRQIQGAPSSSESTLPENTGSGDSGASAESKEGEDEQV